MKLISFAVVSFLAATVSAGFSETLGNADYTAHQLEKRDPSEDMQKQLKEEIEHDRKHYEDALTIYQAMKHFEGELEDEVFHLKFELQNEGHKSPGGGLSDRYNMAISSYNDQQKACYDQYAVMMKLKEALQKKVSEASALKENQKQLTEHNENHPDDLWEVTPPTSYNKEILFGQVSAICNSVEGVDKLKDQYKAASKEMYTKLMASGSNKKSLQKQYTGFGTHLMKIKEEVWMNTVTCDHTTALYTRLFAS